VLGVGPPCAAGDTVSYITLKVAYGLYTVSIGHNINCDDISHLPLVHSTSVGPVVL
jgi:hypothetical protein